MSVFLYLLLLIPSIISMVLLIKQAEEKKAIQKMASTQLPESFLDLLDPVDDEGDYNDE